MNITNTRRRVVVTLLAVTAVLAIIAIMLYYWWSVGRHQITTNNAYFHSEITTVRAKLTGYIANSYLSDNQFVQAGEIIAQIDESEFVARVAQAEANLQRSQAQTKNLEARKSLQLSLIEQAEADVISQRINIERIDQTLAQLSALRERNYATVDELNYQKISHRKGLAQLKKYQAYLAAQQQKLVVLGSEDQALEAQINQDKASLRLAKIDLENTRIYAPISGIVGKRNLRLGQFAQEGTALASIVPQQDIWVEANFKETQVGNIRKGQPAILEVDAFPNHKIKARVDSLSPATGARFSLLPPENATGNFTKVVQRIPVKIALSQDIPFANRLVPGMSVSVTIDTRIQ